MYCIKVDVGRERARVRDYHSGFLPSYQPAPLLPPDSSGSTFISGDRGTKRLVVPGYIFMLRGIPRAQLVDEEEWKVIDAISDSRPSVLDADTGKITDGPLKAVNHLITRAEGNRIQVTATLLGVRRQYWLSVSTAAPAPAAENKKTGKNEEPEQKREYPPEVKAAMLARAEVIGVHAAAAEYGIAWQTLARIRRMAALQSGQPVAKPKAAPVKTRRRTAGAAAEAGELAALRAENAALKEKAAKLEAKIRNFRQAMANLFPD